MALTTSLYTCHEMIKAFPVDELKHMQQPINSASGKTHGNHAMSMVLQVHAHSFVAYATDMCSSKVMLI